LFFSIGLSKLLSITKPTTFWGWIIFNTLRCFSKCRFDHQRFLYRLYYVYLS